MPLSSNQPHDWKKLYTVSGLVLLSLSLGMTHEHLVQADTNNSNQNPAQAQIEDTARNVSSTDHLGENNSPSYNSSSKVVNQQSLVTPNSDSKSSDLIAEQSSSTAITPKVDNKQAQALTVNNYTPTNNKNTNIANLYTTSFVAKSSMGTDVFDIGNRNYPRVDTVDVSSWQSWMKQDDFNRLKQLGVKSVVIKLTDGDGYVNPAAKQQIQFAQNAGLVVAAYHYAEFNNQKDAVNEANHFADVMNQYGLGGNTVVVADMESVPVKRDNALNDLNAFWNTLSHRGFTHHVVYTSINLDNSYHYSNSVGKSNTWIAQYPYSPRSNNLQHQEYGAWQFSASSVIPGEKNYLDVSIDYRDIFSDHPVEKVDANGNWTLWDGAHQLVGFQRLIDGRLVYYDPNNNGVMVHGNQIVNGHEYLINNSTGAITTGWFTINGQTHYVFSNGTYASGEQCINGYWYHFDPKDNGAMVTGFYNLPSGKKVYYDEQGRMAHGERYIGGHNYQGGHWYNFDQRYGTELTGFQKLSDGRVVYYNQNGQMVHGIQIVNGHPYRFDNVNGALQTGWSTIDGKTYYVNYANNNVAYSTGERFIGGYWYYFDPKDNGAMVTGFYNLPSGKKVYYDEQGRMAHGERYIGGHNYQGGHWYNFDQRYGTELTGFQKLSDGRVVYYNQDGQMVHGTQMVNGHPYHFDNVNGALQTGWSTINGKTYYVTYANNNVAYTTGERAIGGYWYYFDPNDSGAMVTGFYTLPSGKKVYYDEQGRMAHGERYIGGHNYQGGHWYNFDQRYGTELTGFQKLSDGRVVYYNQDGQMLHGVQQIDGHPYRFDNSTGALQTGWSNIDGKIYYVNYANNNVAYSTGERFIGGYWYYFDPNDNGAMVTGFYNLPSGKKVYYDEQGRMAHGERYIGGHNYQGGHWYNFDQRYGTELTGFQKLSDGRVVYYNQDGQMVHGTQTVNGHPYHFDNSTGALKNGWNTFNGKTYYVNYVDNQTAYLTGERFISGCWYYFDPNDAGAMVTGFYTLPGGKKVYYDEQGRMAHGERYIGGHNYQGGHWYNFDQRYGTELTGFQKLSDGRTVYYNQDGQMVHGPLDLNGHHYYFNQVDGRMITGLFFNSDLKGLQYYNDDGQRQNGPVRLNNHTFNFNDAGDLMTGHGEQEINNQWYLFDNNGKLVTGFTTLPDKRVVYYDPTDGQMSHGERQINGKWYFFDYTDGHEYRNAFAHLHDGRTTYYDGDGHMVYGERSINGFWYHFNEVSGAMTKGFYSFPHFGKSVYYGNNGRMAHGWTNINGTRFHFDERDGHILGFNQRVVDWFRHRKGKLTYSMYGSRNGADGTADCSGSMTQAIRDAGGTPYSMLYNTESLHDYLWNNGYHLVGEGKGRQNVQYGDVIIWGRRGYSAGEGGHTLVISSFGSNPECISTSFWTNGARGQAVSELPYYQYWADDDYPYQYVYRQWNQGRS